MTSRVAIVDADTLIFVAAYYAKDKSPHIPEDVAEVYNSVDTMVSEILINTNADKFVVLMKGNIPSHRHRMFPDYKANRPDSPEWLRAWRGDVEQCLALRWKAQFVDGVEVDDAVASIHFMLYSTDIPIICSVDKDFNQIPGWHYNPKTKATTNIGLAEAYNFMCTQLLTGDVTDNIKGVPGVGPAKARKILEIAVDPLNAVLEAYNSHHKDLGYLGLLDFAENVIKIVLKVDKDFQYTLTEVPDSIKQLQKKEIPL